MFDPTPPAVSDALREAVARDLEYLDRKNGGEDFSVYLMESAFLTRYNGPIASEIARLQDAAIAAEAETARLRAALEDAEQRVTNLAAALTSAHRARGVQEKRAAEADDRRVTLEKDRIHPAFSVEVQEHRQQAYEGGWSDGYAEGFAKAEASAALTSQEKTDA